MRGVRTLTYFSHIVPAHGTPRREMAGSGAKSRLEFWRVAVRGGRETPARSDWRLRPARSDWRLRLALTPAFGFPRCKMLTLNAESDWRGKKQLAFVGL